MFGVSKVSQPPEYEFYIIKIEFPMYVIEAFASITHSWEKKKTCPEVFTIIRPQILDIEGRQDIVVIEQFNLVSIDRNPNVCCKSSRIICKLSKNK